MSYILNIDTSGINCSVTIADGSSILSCVEKAEPNIHGSQITLFIQQACQEANIDLKKLDAVSVSKGPGSYTGLRIGVSTAKGIAYALNIPLISTDTLLSLTQHALELYQNPQAVYIPMIDARRMEVYTQVFDSNLQVLESVNAKILDEHSLSNYFDQYPELVIYGDGALKAIELFQNKKIKHVDILYSSSKYMLDQSWKKFNNKEFEDVAYFEPFYLKEFYFKK